LCWPPIFRYDGEGRGAEAQLPSHCEFQSEILHGGRAELQNHLLAFQEGASTIGNNTPISTIDAQLIPGGLASKIAMSGAGVSQAPTPYPGKRISTIVNICSTIEHNWSTIE